MPSRRWMFKYLILSHFLPWVVLFWLSSRRNRKGYFKGNSRGSCRWGILTQQFLTWKQRPLSFYWHILLNRHVRNIEYKISNARERVGHAWGLARASSFLVESAGGFIWARNFSYASACYGRLYFLKLSFTVECVTYARVVTVYNPTLKGMWQRYGEAFKKVWAASAFKGTILVYMLVLGVFKEGVTVVEYWSCQ